MKHQRNIWREEDPFSELPDQPVGNTRIETGIQAESAENGWNYEEHKKSGCQSTKEFCKDPEDDCTV